MVKSNEVSQIWKITIEQIYGNRVTTTTVDADLSEREISLMEKKKNPRLSIDMDVFGEKRLASREITISREKRQIKISLS